MTPRLQTRLLAAALLLLGAAAAVAQDRRPSGAVIIESASGGAGGGVTWADGRLTYHGTTHTFSIEGLGVADPGPARVGARGEVYDLKALDDFEGTYVAAPGATWAGGAAVMVNPAGVTMRLAGVGRGVRVTLGASGVRVALKR
jgi:hypothetical protein